MEEMTTGLCPKCGHTLQIPAELERFSCMYCGERLTKRQLLTQPEEASCSEEDCAVSFDHAVSRLGWCVQNFRGYQKKILRDAFFEAFETYETGCAPVIQELNSGVRPELIERILAIYNAKVAPAVHSEGSTGLSDLGPLAQNVMTVAGLDEAKAYYEGGLMPSREALRKAGYEPVDSPIRGGTDGARLSFEGLPCPNLCTGGENFHGRFEYIPAEDMERITQLLAVMLWNLAE